MKRVEQKKQPDIARRIGMVLYWFGCGFGILSIPMAVFAFYQMWSQFGVEGSTFLAAALCLGAGLGAWLVGRVARYVLKGD